MAKKHPRANSPDRTKSCRGIRIRSMRGYRRRLDDLTQQAIKGLISWADVARAATAIKAAGEMFMAEHLLARSGGDQEVEDHPLGARGGLEEFSAAKQFRKKTITARTGEDKFGVRIDDKTVKIETSAGDETAETDAEIEALT